MPGNLTLQGGAFVNFEGVPVAFGTLLMTLSHDESYASSNQVVAGLKLVIDLDANGNINPTVNVYSSDALLPLGSYYIVYCYDASGALVFGPQYWQLSATPNPLNVATIIPLFPPGTGLSGGGGGGSGSVDSVALTINSTSPSGIFTVTGSPITTTGVLNINLAGTSGGLPFFSSSNTLSSSGLLSGIVRGSGSGFTASEISGDGTTIGSNVLTLATVNSNVGTFTNASITVNAKGLVTAASTGGGGGGGGGTVTSVGLTVNSTSPSGIFTVTGSPVTSLGSLNLNLAGTSGGLPYFSSSSVLSSSGALTGLVRGNGSSFSASEISGDATTSGSNALTFATVNSSVGSFTNANITVNAKGLVTSASNGSGGGGGTGAQVVATVDLTNRSAALTPTTLFTVATTGLYLITWSADITTAATTSSSLGGNNGFQIVFTSPTDSTVKTTIPGNSVVSFANTTGTAIGGSFSVYAKIGTNILYQFDYLSTGATAMVYEIHIAAISA
jgi:hypothetical protein